MTYVYKHTFPNGKIYIGIADNYLNRWNNGSGYADNPPMYSAVKEYGWDNIKHEILKKCETREEAEALEQRLILAYQSENPEIGYNRTTYTKTLLSLNLMPVVKEKKNTPSQTDRQAARAKREAERQAERERYDEERRKFVEGLYENEDWLNLIRNIKNREIVEFDDGIFFDKGKFIEVTKEELDLIDNIYIRSSDVGMSYAQMPFSGGSLQVENRKTGEVTKIYAGIKDNWEEIISTFFERDPKNRKSYTLTDRRGGVHLVEMLPCDVNMFEKIGFRVEETI